MYRLLGSKVVDFRAHPGIFRTIVGQVTPNVQLEKVASRLTERRLWYSDIMIFDLRSGVNQAALLSLENYKSRIGARCVLIVSEQELQKHSRDGIKSRMIETAHRNGAILQLSDELLPPNDKYSLTFIDVLKAALSGAVYVISNSPNIRGGSRFTVAYAEHLGRPVIGVNGRENEFKPTYVPFGNETFTHRERTLRNLVYELTGR